MPKRKLLICFDAFGTLFAPKRPVHQQYAEVARSVGLKDIRDADVERTFRDAYKEEASKHPNFGKAKGMNAEQWWTNIITNTFLPIVGKDTQLPHELVPKLLYRFWSDEGYNLMPGVHTLFQKLQRRFTAGDMANRRVVVGVVTNSDDRVPDILSSLDIHVNHLRYGDQTHSSPTPEKQNYDIDFAVMSFDVGHEKPAKEIFKAAEEMLQPALEGAGDESLQDPAAWQKVYVGDEYKKDVLGAVNAGWSAVLIGPHEEVRQHSDVRWLDDQPNGNLLESLETSRAVGFSTLGKLATWLPEEL